MFSAITKDHTERRDKLLSGKIKVRLFSRKMHAPSKVILRLGYSVWLMITTFNPFFQDGTSKTPDNRTRSHDVCYVKKILAVVSTLSLNLFDCFAYMLGVATDDVILN